MRIVGTSVVLLALSGCMMADPPAAERDSRMADPLAAEMEMVAGINGLDVGFAEPAPQAVMRPSPAPMKQSLVTDLLDATPQDGTLRILKKSSPSEPAEAEARVRQWFPEAFLWRPSVVTENGSGTIDVRVPDALTEWRVLALAHDRSGHQAGTEHRFASVLPVSVDPVTPGWLYVGDEVQISSQASAMGSPFTGSLEVQAEGALSGRGGGGIDLLAGGSALVPTKITAERSGQGLVRAELFADQRVDGAERSVIVRPTGRPVREQRGGGLSGERSFTFNATDAIEQRVVVRVFPGPLSVFQAELERVGDRPPGAYGYALLDGLQRLSATAGVDVDEQALRALRIRSWQRLVRESRNLDGPRSMALLTGLKVPADDVLAETTYNRVVRTLEQAQRGDGTWSHTPRTTASHVIVQTAASARALPKTSRAARSRASGALERLVPNVKDRYTAAWMLASGVVDVSLRDALEAIVLEGIEQTEEGRHVLTSVPDLLGPHGPPTHTEELAVTYLALAERTDLAWRGDLLSELLEGWSASRGLGGGWADALALSAIQEGLPTLSAPVLVKLARDGEALGSGQLDPTQPLLPVVLQAEGGGTFQLSTEPPMPGLVFVASATAWVPFTGAESLPGVEVEITTDDLRAGEEGVLRITLAAPSGAVVHLSQGLPAGTVAEFRRGSLGFLADHQVLQDHVELSTRPFGAGEVMELELAVTPMFRGSMGTPPLTITVGERSADLRPLRWKVR